MVFFFWFIWLIKGKWEGSCFKLFEWANVRMGFVLLCFWVCVKVFEGVVVGLYSDARVSALSHCISFHFWILAWKGLLFWTVLMGHSEIHFVQFLYNKGILWIMGEIIDPGWLVLKFFRCNLFYLMIIISFDVCFWCKSCLSRFRILSSAAWLSLFWLLIILIALDIDFVAVATVADKMFPFLLLVFERLLIGIASIG